MNYNFIGRLETFDNDLELLVSRLNVSKARISNQQDIFKPKDLILILGPYINSKFV